MKFISRFISALLSLTIIVTVSAFILSATIWNESKLHAATSKADIAGKVAAVLPDILKTNLGLTTDEAFIIKTVFTKDRVQPYVDQFTSALAKSDGQALRIDLMGVRRDIAAESLPLTPTVADLTAKPVTLIPTEQSGRLATIKHGLDRAKLFGPIFALVLIALILVVAKHSRWVVLAEAGIMIALGLGLLGLILPSLPGIVTSSVGASAAAPLRDTVTEFLKSLFDSAQADYYRAALIAGGVAVALFALHFLARLFGKFSHSKKHA